MDFSLSQHPDEPGVYCTEAELAFVGSLPCALDIFQDPSHLGGTEICIDDQSCLLADEIGLSLFLQLVAVG